MSGSFPFALLPVAHSLIAARGIRGLSMRSVAQEAGTSVGSINYRIGDKNALIAQLIAEEMAARRKVHERWKQRIRGLDMATPPVLATLITAYIDDIAAARDAAITRCELALEAGLNPSGFSGMGQLLEEEAIFWAETLLPVYGDRARLLARAIAGYCHDELPFSLALPSHSDYRLLRAATIQRLSEGLAGQASGLALSFDRLVEACGTNSASSLHPLEVDLPEGSKKAELAGHAAAVITRLGASAVTHRAVAGEAGISNSTLSHHFRTQEDLLQAGMGALILNMRRHIRSDSSESREEMRRMTAIRATHSIALTACRNPHLAPFALDMRRRRAENVWASIGKSIAGDEGLDRTAIQSAVIVTIGSALAAQTREQQGEEESSLVTLAMLAQLRQSFMAQRKQAA